MFRFRRLHLRPRRNRDREKLDYIMELKNVERGRIKEYAEKYGVKYVAGAKPWFEKADIALPSATQNEINEEAAKALIANGVIAVSEGANMPSTQRLSRYSRMLRFSTLQVRQPTQVVLQYQVLR